MTAEEIWRKSRLTGNYEAWAFGEAPDKLASLVKDYWLCPDCKRRVIAEYEEKHKN